MNDFLMPIAKLCLLVFVVSALFGTGATLTVRQILDPLRNIRLVIISLLVSFLMVPLIAFVITRIHPLETPLQVGLILLSMTAGSEALPKISGIVKGSTGYAVGLMCIQIVVSLVYVPLVISVLLPQVSLNHFKLLMKLVLCVLLPLVGGLFLKARHESAAEVMEHALHKVSMVSLLLVFTLLIVAKFEVIRSMFRLEVILPVIIYLALAFIAGYLLGGPKPDTRTTLAVGSILRSGSIAMVVGSQAFSDPKVVIMIIFIFILMMPVLPVMVLMFRGRSRPGI